jgi:hypothetical protein
VIHPKFSRVNQISLLNLGCKAEGIAMNEENLTTLMFALFALIAFVAVYIMPVAGLIVGGVLLKKTKGKSLAGKIFLCVFGLMFFAVIAWRIWDWAHYSGLAQL